MWWRPHPGDDQHRGCGDDREDGHDLRAIAGLARSGIGADSLIPVPTPGGEAGPTLLRWRPTDHGHPEQASRGRSGLPYARIGAGTPVATAAHDPGEGPLEDNEKGFRCHSTSMTGYSRLSTRVSDRSGLIVAGREQPLRGHAGVNVARDEAVYLRQRIATPDARSFPDWAWWPVRPAAYVRQGPIRPSTGPSDVAR